MIRVHSYESMGTYDGPGLRLVVFLQGCPFKCLYCANPDTIPFEGGTATEIEDIVSRAVNQKAFFGKRGGVTFSGGDPLYQCDAVTELARRIKEETDKTIWCYTGFRYEEIQADERLHQILPYIDTLVDGPFIAELRDPDLPFRGSSNQRIIHLTKKEDDAIPGTVSI